VLRELEETEQRKLNELLEAVVGMLAGNLLAVLTLVR
jgi:hypothetical protein